MILSSKNKQFDTINQTIVVKLNQITFTFLNCGKEEKRTRFGICLVKWLLHLLQTKK